MTSSTSRAVRLLAVVGIALMASACSGSASIESTVAAAPAEPTTVEVATSAPAPTPASAAVDTQTETAEEAPAPAVEEEAPSSGGMIDVVFDDGRSWTMPTTDCYTAPDSASGVFFMVGENADGARLDVIESWPLDGDRSGGTAFIATFFDESGTFYNIERATVADTGAGLTFTSGIAEGLSDNYTIQATFTCTP